MISTFTRMLAACSLLATTALAQTPPPRIQLCAPTQTIPLQFTNWQNGLIFPKFDPALGILVGVQVSLGAQVEVNAKFESTDAAPAVVNLAVGGDVRVLRPGNGPVIVSASPTFMVTESVSAFDGTIDFLGTSGRTYPTQLIAQSDSMNLGSGSDLSIFTGLAGNPGTIVLPVTAMGTSNSGGLGNLVLSFATRAAADIQVCYLYYPDCNNNQIADYLEIQGNPNLDRYGVGTCSPDGILDVCQPEADCDSDGLPNRCELVGNDCDGNLFPDNCQPDCDGNGLADACEILGGARDLYGPTTCTPDGIPDSCQVQPDCDNDGIPNRCELAGNDCDANQFPDNCQPDCDGDGIADACEILAGAPDLYGPTTCTPDGIPDSCQMQPDCDGDGIPNRCELAGNDCDGNQFPDNCQPDCDGDGLADVCEILAGARDLYGPTTCTPDGIPDSCQMQPDCDNDGIPNRCELAGNDCDANQFPDNCQPDCDGDGLADACEILAGARDLYGPSTCTPDGIPDSCQMQPDCDGDGIPNRCELVGNDCDANQFPDNCQPDCDGDGLADACEILAGAPDRYGRSTCAPDGVPDSCQVQPDCDNDGLPNRCELAGNDCDGNQFPDNCQPDCDGDGIADACEILAGAPDLYGRASCSPDGIPDSCQVLPDCDNDGIPNRCELGGNDCDGNAFPDNCQPDCDGDGIADACEILSGAPDRYGRSTCTPDGVPDSCQAQPDCDNDGLPNRCELVGNDCDGNLFPDNCQPDCDGDGLADVCEILGGAPDRYGPTTCSADGIPDSCQSQPDCDGDGIPDRCELLGGTPDTYGPGTCAPDNIPDSCQFEPDCDMDGTPDRCEIAGGAVDRYGRTTCVPDGVPDICQAQPDCDGDGLPDRCQIAGNDCDGNLIPDNCQTDCNSDGTIDACEVDCNADGTPDECQALDDCDGNGIPDVCELVGNDCNTNGILDTCEKDCDGNGTPDDCDIAADPTIDSDDDGIPDTCECLELDRHRPGSLLLFPKYDNRSAQRTLFTVTNTHPSQSIDVHFVFRDGTTCLEFNYSERLTPKDTITLLTRTVNPTANQGYAYAYAQSTTTGQPIVFNHLIGQALAIDGITTFEYALDAVSFEGIGNGMNTNTDVDSDGRRDLDGLEYAQAPDQILIPRFLGQTEVSASEFVFVDLTSGPAFQTVVDYLVYNDNEEAFSGQYQFRCWQCITLTNLAGSFSNAFLSGLSSNDPKEIQGLPGFETGWVRFDGRIAFSNFTQIDDPAIYVVLIERHAGYAAADLPYEVCSQDNGSLLPLGPQGDN